MFYLCLDSFLLDGGRRSGSDDPQQGKPLARNGYNHMLTLTSDLNKALVLLVNLLQHPYCPELGYTS
jgi:hypothetical protein